MNKEINVFTLNQKAILAAILATIFPVVGHTAAAARVEFSVGNVSALGSDGSLRQLAKGSDINSGDTIKTIDGRAQLRFSDGGYISLQPNTDFKVDQYNFSGAADGSEKGFFSLVKGGLRAISGAIGHTNRSSYRVNTPVATIGIRGTEYSMVQVGDKWLVKVGDGSVFLENQGGSLVLYKGQSAEIAGQGVKPEYSETQPSVTAAAPRGNDPQKNQDDQNKQAQQNTIFNTNEQYTADGTSTAFNGTSDDSTLKAIQGYAANNAVGTYNLDPSLSGVATAGGYDYKATGGYLNIAFSTLAVDGDIEIGQKISGSTNGYSNTTHFSGSGSLTANSPAFGFDGSSSGSGGICAGYGGCSLSATGLLKGPTAQRAEIGYTLSNVGSFGGSGSTASSTAVLIAPSVPAPYSPPL